MISQNISGVYIWKTNGIENDTIVKEISIINDSTFVEKNFIGDKTKLFGIYQTWPVTIKNGFIKKESPFYCFYFDNNKPELQFKCKIKSNSLWLYSLNSKTLKYKRLKQATFVRKASL